MQSICVFRLGELMLCISIHQVQEVLEQHKLMPIPLAPPIVKGLINLRGLVVTAIDTRMVFDLPWTPVEMNTQLVVLTSGHPLSLLVDEVLEVATLNQPMIPPPSHLPQQIRSLALGAICREKDLLLVVDADRIAERIAACNSGRSEGSCLMF